MNPYHLDLLRAAIRITGKPVSLSPLLEDFWSWSDRRMQISSEPADFRIVLNVECLKLAEVDVNVVKSEDGKNPFTLLVTMKHGLRRLADNELKWERDCAYEYKQIVDYVSQSRLTAFWTDDQFLVIQARNTESLLTKEFLSVKLIPIRIGHVLRPGMDVALMKERMQTILKKVEQIQFYVKQRLDVSEDNDVLCLLKSVPRVKDKLKPFDINELNNELNKELKTAPARKTKSSTDGESDSDSKETRSKDSSSKSSESDSTLRRSGRIRTRS